MRIYKKNKTIKITFNSLIVGENVSPKKLEKICKKNNSNEVIELFVKKGNTTKLYKLATIASLYNKKIVVFSNNKDLKIKSQNFINNVLTANSAFKIQTKKASKFDIKNLMPNKKLMFKNENK